MPRVQLGLFAFSLDSSIELIAQQTPKIIEGSNEHFDFI
jgi:hypothetical protein